MEEEIEKQSNGVRTLRSSDETGWDMKYTLRGHCFHPALCSTSSPFLLLYLILLHLILLLAPQWHLSFKERGDVHPYRNKSL